MVYRILGAKRSPKLGQLYRLEPFSPNPLSEIRAQDPPGTNHLFAIYSPAKHLFQHRSTTFGCKLFPFRDYFLAFSVDTVRSHVIASPELAFTSAS
jgi:hypothetical protein